MDNIQQSIYKKRGNLRTSCTILNKNTEVKFVKEAKDIITPFQYEKELITAPLWLPQSTKSLIPIKEEGRTKKKGQEITVEV